MDLIYNLFYEKSQNEEAFGFALGIISLIFCLQSHGNMKIKICYALWWFSKVTVADRPNKE